MLLKSIKIQGFKSFADKTQLQFGNGITAVVGPNGSGKSNISDAVRWVLGEQSTKSLRGSSMEDVIFIGSDTRRAQGFAEVTLTIDNSDRSLNFDNDTVAVTRRYYRSHESEYLINGVSVRLRDVNELFMDTGLGRDGYSMIGQGKIDSIVGAKPNERRDIFEEASGISRYRYRKIEAERKLSQAEENMVRLRDIFKELEDRIGPLKAQSEKAQKYLKYRDERKQLEIGLWLNELDNSKDNLRNHERKITVAKMQYDEIIKKLEDIAKLEEKAQEQNAFYISLIEQKRNHAAELEENVARTEGEIAVEENTILHNNQNISRIDLEIEGLRSSDETTKETETAEREKLNRKTELLNKTEQEILSLSEQLNTLVSESEGVSGKIEQLVLTLNQLTRDNSDMQVSLVSANTAISEIASRKEAIEQNKVEVLALLDEYNDELQDLVEEKKTLEDSRDSYVNSINGYKMRRNSREETQKNLLAVCDKLRLDIEDNTRRIELLQELERNMEGFNHAVKTVITEHKNGVLRGICGPVVRLIKVKDEYSVAIETALAAAAQNIICETEADAKRAIKMLKEGKKGRATFLPVNTIRGRYIDEKGLDDMYGFVGIASDLVITDQKYREIVVSLLGRIIVAEDLDSAVNIASKLSYKYKVVSLDGQQVSSGGALTGGSLSKHIGLLSRSGEIADLKREGTRIKTELEEAEKSLQKANLELEAVDKDITNIEVELKTASDDLIRVLGEIRRVEDLKTANEQNLNTLEKELTDCELRKKEQQRIVTTKSIEIEQFEAKQSEIKAQIDEMSGGRENLTRKRDELSSSLTEKKLLALELNKDVEAIKRTITQITEAQKDREYHIDQLDLQKRQLEEMNKNIEQRIENLKTSIDDLRQKGKLELQEAENLRKEREEAEQQNVKARQEERVLIDDKEKLNGELVRLEERREVMVHQYDDIIKKLFDEYELTRSEAEELNILIEDAQAAKRELVDIKNKMRALGNVNIDAIDEYKEVKERHEFLSAQIEDVEKSQKELTKIINELTATMRDMFRDGFDKINRNFQKTFTDLFGGGSAELILSEPDNILESGIDISVRIPGKTVTKIELLSGGEKALVAISIYFAIMMVTPPPFCILDEVESALDEVNVDRVADYMRHMNDSTQFICITHRRGTMEAADMLYGVTMQEKGVSKLLELNVTELEKKLGINN